MAIRIAAWNVGHQTLSRAIPETLVPALRTLSPDVIVLTEFVPADRGKSERSRKPFYESLEQAGMRYLLPDYPPEITRDGQRNHALIASNLRMERGDIVADKTPLPGPTNFLHVRFPDTMLEVAGMRVPCFETREAMTAYWNWLTSMLEHEADRPLVVIGDVNVDPRSPRPKWKGRYIDRIQAKWQIPDPLPVTSGSCISKVGKWTRIDHAFVSKSLHIDDTTYVAQNDNHVFASQQGKLSDHAVLIVDVTVPGHRQEERP